MPAYEHFSSSELLGKLATEKMLAKLSTCRYRIGLEPVGTEVEDRSKGKSRSAVSRRFVQATEHALGELLATRLDDLDLVALMIEASTSPTTSGSWRGESTSRARSTRSRSSRATPRTRRW